MAEIKDKPQIYFGRNPVLEALHSGASIDKLMVQQDLRGEIEVQLRKLAKLRHIPFKKVPQQKLDTLIKGNHQGVLAFGSPIPLFPLEDILAQIFESGENPNILVLDRITDVRNFGAIARSALAFGVHALVIPVNNSAEINHFAVKTSAGALWKLKVSRVPNLEQALSVLKNYGLKVYAADKDKATTPLHQIIDASPKAIILGSEGLGVRRELLNLSDMVFSIDQTDAIESLNVSVAAGIILNHFYVNREV